jgi:hypothetical protein
MENSQAATSSPTRVVLSWAFRRIKLNESKVTQPHLIAVHEAVYMVAGEHVSRMKTLSSGHINVEMVKVMKLVVDEHLHKLLDEQCDSLPDSFGKVCRHTNVFIEMMKQHQENTKATICSASSPIPSTTTEPRRSVRRN